MVKLKKKFRKLVKNGFEEAFLSSLLLKQNSKKLKLIYFCLRKSTTDSNVLIFAFVTLLLFNNDRVKSTLSIEIILKNFITNFGMKSFLRVSENEVKLFF